MSQETIAPTNPEVFDELVALMFTRGDLFVEKGPEGLRLVYTKHLLDAANGKRSRLQTSYPVDISVGLQGTNELAGEPPQLLLPFAEAIGKYITQNYGLTPQVNLPPLPQT